MYKYKVLFLVYLVASTQALNWPESAPSSTTERTHQRHKRETEEIHTIDVHQLKEKLTEAYHIIQPLIENLLADVSPSIYEEFETNFIPKIRKIAGDVLPILCKNMNPEVRKYVKFALNVAEEVAKRAYVSYKLSNSTHLSIVSVSDIVDEVLVEMKPLLNAVKYLSARMPRSTGQYRGKRDVRYMMHNGKTEKVHFIDVHELKERLVETYDIVKPLIEDLISEVSPSIYETVFLSWFPRLRQLKNEFLPFFRAPQASKFLAFAQNIGDRLLDKAYKAFTLTNSTHIAIVSVSDVARDVHNELKPALNLFKFLSASIMKNQQYRGKRESFLSENELEGGKDEVHFIDIRELKDSVTEAYHTIRPLIENILAEVAPSIYHKITFSYLPYLRELKIDVMPFLSGYVCPQIQKYFSFVKSIADRLIDQTYRSYKMSNSTHIAIISITDIVDEAYEEFEPVLEFVKSIFEGLANRRQHRIKRDALDMLENELFQKNYEVHTIDIHELKDKIVEAYKTIRPLVEKLLAEVTPSIYEKIVLTYLPVLRQLKNDVLPFLRARICPEVQKYMKFAKNVAEKLMKKAYQSFKLSNSTHISIVSVNDVVDEVFEEVKPLVQLAKFFAANMMMQTRGHYRGKRSVMPEQALSRSKRQVPDIIFTMMSPYIESFFRSMSSTILGNGDSLLSKVLLPLVYDILSDDQSRFDVMSLFTVGKASFTPLIWEMMKRQAYNTPEGTVIRIPRYMYQRAVASFVTDARPIIRKLMERHIEGVLKNMVISSKNVVDYVDRLLFERYEGADILKDQVINFLNKHREMFRTSTKSHVHMYTITEIMNDLQPIKFSALKVFLQYLKRSPNSWLSMLFGDGALLQRIAVGTPVYAKPQTTARPVYNYVYRGKKQTYSNTV